MKENKRKIRRIHKDKHRNIVKITYGITRAPRRAIVSPVAPDPLKLGMNSPWITSFEGGFTMLISMKKHAAMVNTNSATKSSSFLTYINVQNKGYMSLHMHEKFFYKW